MSKQITKTNQGFPSLFSSFFNDEGFFNNSKELSIPPVNVKETDTNYSLEFAAPGMEKEDFNVTVNDNILSVSSEKRSEESQEEDNYTRKEFSYSSFNRSFSLPETIDQDAIEATYNDGLLKINLVKLEKEEEVNNDKTIEVK